ncbi:MAG: divergent polysaccharide deacetylase family protein [Nitrospirota bacterium]|nr:divergent polysaccharide deacetylase family protein [Nitrospirota bacterium]
MAQKKLPARRGGKGDRYTRVVTWSIVVLLIGLAVLLWGPWKGKRAPKTGQEPRQPRIAGVVAIVIDDLGEDLASAHEVLDLPGRVSLSVIPRRPQSRKVAELARKEGRELLVHVPMEPKDRSKMRTPNTLRADMTPMEFIQAVNDNLDAVPGAAGVNNHEGSALTENREAMNFLMSELKARNLFFLDSFTNPKSVAADAARAFGIRTSKRDVFLDNAGDDPAAIRKQLQELARIARKSGHAIGIGHPHAATLAELRKWLPKAAEQGIEVVPVSHLLK